MKKIFLLIIAIVLLFSNAVAQTVVWQMRPGEYDSIKRLNNNLYLVTKGGKSGVIASDGTVKIPVTSDNMSLFHDGRAIFTSANSKGNRINGVLNVDGRCYSFDNDFYTIAKQEFFSDDVIPVSDGNGNLGYVNEQGLKVTGFDKGWTSIKPFTEGHASVYKDDKYFLIDKGGTPAKFIVNGVCQITVGTNPYRGLAYLFDGRAKKWYCYDIDKKGELKKAKNIKEKQPKVDYLYRLSSLTEKSMEVPFTDSYNEGVIGVSPIENNGKFGFRDNDTEIVPCQFSEATPFEDSYAIVKHNDKFGILRYVDTDRFGAVEDSQDKKFSTKDVRCAFTLYVPSVWENKDLKMTLMDDRGFYIPMKNDDGHITFDYRPATPGTHAFRLTVTGDGLTLFEKELSYDFAQSSTTTREQPRQKATPVQKLCPTCGKNIKDCKYHGVH